MENSPLLSQMLFHLNVIHSGEVCIQAKWPIRPELIPVSEAWSDWEYLYSPLDGMLVHRKVTPSIKFAGTHLFSVFMWCNHIPKLNSTFPSQVLVPSDKRPYRKMTFHNVSARQGSSYCNRPHLNFQAFALRDMKIATWEVYRVGQKMSYHFSFC